MSDTIQVLDMHGLALYKQYSQNEITEMLSAYMTQVNPVGSGTFSFGRQDNTTIGQRSIVLGSNATASGKDTVVLGRKGVATGNYAISMGYGNQVSGDNAVVIGVNSVSSSGNSIAIGTSNTASGWGGHCSWLLHDI